MNAIAVWPMYSCDGTMVKLKTGAVMSGVIITCTLSVPQLSDAAVTYMEEDAFDGNCVKVYVSVKSKMPPTVYGGKLKVAFGAFTADKSTVYVTVPQTSVKLLARAPEQIEFSSKPPHRPNHY